MSQEQQVLILSSTAALLERAHSLTERAAQAEALAADPDSTAQEKHEANETLKQVELAAFKEAIAINQPRSQVTYHNPQSLLTARVLSTLYRKAADFLLPSPPPTPSQEEASVTIDRDLVADTLRRQGHQPTEQEIQATMTVLQSLWDYEHLEKKANEIIEYALERARTPGS